MKLTLTNPATLHSADAHALTLTGTRGELFRVTVLEQDLIRVQHLPEGKPRLDRTWMIVGQDDDTPREGRRRDDLSPFMLPEFSHEKAEGLIHPVKIGDLGGTVHTGVAPPINRG